MKRLEAGLRQVWMGSAAMLSILLLGACTGGSTPVVETATPVSEPGQSSIAYLGTDGNLYLMDSAGDQRVPVTDEAVSEGENVRSYQNPTWDPATGALAYIELAASQGGIDEALVRVLPAGAEEARIAFRDEAHIPIYLDWSPRGSRLTVLTSRLGDEELRLWLTGVDRDRVEIDQGQPYYWDWHADGERIYAHVGGSVEANPAAARLTYFPEFDGEGRDLDWQPSEFRAPAFRPNVGGLLVAAERSGLSQLLLLDDQGQLVDSLVDLEQSVAFGWSANGRRLAYVEGSDQDPHTFGELVLMELAANGQVEESQDTGLSPVVAFFWSPGGERVAAFVLTSSRPGQDQLVADLSQPTGPELRLVIVEADSGEHFELARFRPTDDWLSVVTYHDQYQRSSTIWSPEGDRLVYSAQRSGGQPGIFIVRAEDGAQAELVAQGSLAFWSFAPTASDSASEG